MSKAFSETQVFKPNLRQARLLEMILEQGFAETDVAAQLFAKTTQTIRRDFDLLAKQGLIRRVHGGASAPDGFQNRPYSERRATQSDEKNNIGIQTAKRIPQDSCVFLSLGTSTEAVARHLTEHVNMHFVTNNLNIAHVFRHLKNSTLTVCGGRVRLEDGGMLNPEAVDLIDNHRFDIGVIGAGALSDTGQLYCYSIDEARMAKAVIASSDKVILVADDNKIGQKANFKMASLSDIDIFVTGETKADYIRAICAKNDVNLVNAYEN